MIKEKPHNKKNTICFFNTNTGWGGGEKWYLENACGLNQRGYSVCIVAYPGSPLHQKAVAAGITAFGLKLNNLSFLNFFHLRNIGRIFRQTETDVVLFNLSRDVKAGGFAAWKAGVSQRIYRRGSALPVKNTPLNRYVFKNAVTEIIANSEQTKRMLLRNNPTIQKKKITVLYNGINTHNYFPKDKSPWQNRPFIIGNVGRLSAEKGQQHFIEIARQLRAQHAVFKIVVAGDGKLQQKLAAETEQNNLQEYIHWAGYIEDINSFLGDIDVFVLTSHREGFGYVVVEAMLCGLPVVAFNIGTTSEIIDDGTTGYLIPPYDSSKMSEAIERLRLNPAAARRMGEQGRKRAFQLFDFEKSLDRLEQTLILR